MAQGLVVLLAALVLGGIARADLASGRDKLLHGDYAAARQELEQVGGSARGEAAVLLIKLDLRTGNYAGAARRARALARGGTRRIRAEAEALQAEVALITGRYQEACKQLEGLTAREPRFLRARYLLGRCYRSTGQADRARAVFEWFFAEYNGGRLSLEHAEQAMYLALAARYTGSFEDANDAFREAVSLDPNLLEANIEWGHLFLEKYSASYAEQSFDEVLKIDSSHPDAHAGMAQAKIEQSYAVAAARDHLAHALAANPNHPESLLLQASLEIDANRWEQARATLKRVLAVNPNHLEALALIATIYWLRDDMAAYEKQRKLVFAINPRFAGFYHIVARSAVREHRYDEAIELEQQAVAVDPDFFLAMQEIGTGLLRLGKDDEGVQWLRRAWSGDEFNVRTYNLLDLFEEVIPKEYVFVTSKNFRIRYHKTERPLLARYVEPLLETAYADMVKRYRYTPKRPTTIELFQNPDHYSVRTVGLPNLGALGVCFGRVITAMSPANGNMNWAMVLWHELSHVFAIQISKSRVPRWFTEGLAEYETVIARPEWRRENDADVWEALQSGTLPSVLELNHDFLRPNMEQVVVAYHTSSLVIQFISERWGFPALLQGLHLYGKGMDTAAVIKGITQLEPAQFDAEFRKHLRVRFAAYKGTFRLPTSGFDDVAALERAAQSAPNDAAAQARYALGAFYAGDADAAAKAAATVLRLEPKNYIAIYISAELALRMRDQATAKRLYGQLIAAGGDGYEPRLRLGFLAAEAADVDEARKQLARAKQLDPERSEPYIILAELYEKRGQHRDALAEYEQYVVLEQMQPAPVMHLTREYAKAGMWDKVRKYGEMALNINPNSADLLLDLGRAYLETGAPRRSLHAYGSALLTSPKPRRPALAHLGQARAYLALKDRSRAAAALAAALKLEPGNQDAQQLRSQVGK
jgi:cellulose synthase operon protein C